MKNTTTLGVFSLLFVIISGVIVSCGGDVNASASASASSDGDIDVTDATDADDNAVADDNDDNTSYCGDQKTTGSEKCDGDVALCTFLSESLFPYNRRPEFSEGMAYCNPNCLGWDVSRCVYKACPSGGIPTYWGNAINNEQSCYCSPECGETKCEVEGDVCFLVSYPPYCVKLQADRTYAPSVNCSVCIR